MTAILLPVPKARFFNAAGVPLAGGKVYTYAAGTTTPKATYTDFGALTANTNPVILDANGEADIWLSGSYKIILKDASDAQQWSVDNVSDSADLLRQDLASTSDVTKGDALIGVKSTLSGAVARTQHAKNADLISLADFGAVGDGTTDDTAAITAALATGKDILIPEKTYLVTAGFTISTVGQRVIGSGWKSIIQQGGTPTYDLFTIAADNVQIENLRFNGAQTAATATVYWAIITDAVANPKNVKIHNCKFSGSGGTVGFTGAIKFNASADYGSVTNCYVERLWGSATDCGYGVLAGNVQGLKVINCVGVGTSGRGRHLVYFSAGASYCVAAYNYITGFGEAGISQFSQSAQPICEGNLYLGNSLVNCQTNATSTASSLQISGHSRHAKIINNSIYGSGRNGISVYNFLYSDCYDTIVSGNSVDSSAYYGIWFYGSTGGKCIDNNVRESSKVAVGTYANILIDTDGSIPSTNILVEGNSSTGASFAKSAFEMTAGCTAIVNDNYFPVCNVNDIVLAATAAPVGSDVMVAWTPVLKFGGATTGITYTTQRGGFIKTGRRITCTLFIALSSKGSATGAATITGFPFNSTNQDSAASVQLNGVTTTGQAQAYVATNILQLQAISTLGVVTNLADTDFSNASTIRMTITYFV